MYLLPYQDVNQGQTLSFVQRRWQKNKEQLFKK